jgi:GTP 3',8-cyclase
MDELWRNGKLRLIVAGGCNLACFYCHNEGQDKHEALMGMDLVERVCGVAQHSGPPLREVTISGGEPLLHPAIEEIVARVAELGAPVTMVTNATLLTAARIGTLRKAGLAKARIGLDSLRAGKPRPSPGYLPSSDSVPAAIDAALAAGLPVELNTVLTRYNMREVPELARFAIERSLSVKFFEHVQVIRYGAAGHPGSMRSRPQVTFDEFAILLRTAGIDTSFTESPDIGPANVLAGTGSGSIRYCQYLCPHGLCWTTGTRVDPLGYIYSCMVNRGLDRLPALPRQDATTIARAAARPCRSAGGSALQPLPAGSGSGTC